MRPLIAVLVVLLGLAACKSGKTDTASANLPAGDALLKESSAAMHDIKTAKFLITADGAIAGLNLHKAEGTLTREGNAKGTAQIDQSGATVELSFVIVGDKIYLKGPTGGYQALPLALAASVYDPSAILNPDRGIAKVLSTATDAKTEAIEEVDGKQAYRVAATMNAARPGHRRARGDRPGARQALDRRRRQEAAQGGVHHAGHGRREGRHGHRDVHELRRTRHHQCTVGGASPSASAARPSCSPPSTRTSW